MQYMCLKDILKYGPFMLTVPIIFSPFVLTVTIIFSLVSSVLIKG